MRNRLAKVLAAAGVASRRKCEEIIQAGRVTVNGEKIVVPQHMTSLDEDTLTVDGKPVAAIEKKLYFILNKPVGTLCSSTGNNRVIDLFDVKERLFTVGRLDKNTTGLLIVTNDGHLTDKIIHPRSGVEKEYVAKVDADLTPEHLRIIKRGTRVEGTFVRPHRVTKVRRNTVKIVVGEGKKREVRHLLEAADLSVAALQRTRIGNLHLGNLPIGQWREVTREYCEQVFG